MSTVASSKKRLFLFYALALALPVLFFGVLEMGLRYFDYGYPHELFVEASDRYGNEPYLMPNEEVARRYFGRNGYAPSPRVELFRRHKPENGYRVFVLGESTTAGWPYPTNAMFSRVLEQRLSDVFPDRYVEVVNIGIAALNSFALTDFVDEVLAQQPDAILIYVGHNEFYGALGAASSVSLGRSRWLVKTYMALLQFKTVALVRDVVGMGKGWLTGSVTNSRDTTLMQRMIGDRQVEYGGDIFQAARDNYAANLREIFAKSKAAGVPVLISEVVSNVRDQPPFASLENAAQPAANSVYAKAQQLEREGKFEQARVAYYRAKDLDGVPFRAPEVINEAIHQVATEFNVPVVPMKSYFEAASPNGIIGASLMLEHVHPNIEGYFLMSEAFFDSMQHYGFIEPFWKANQIPPWFYRQSWPITELDRVIGEMQILNLTDHPPFAAKKAGAQTMVGFVPQGKVQELALQAFRDEKSYQEAHVELAKFYESQGHPDRGFREYEAMMAAEPHNISVYMMAIENLLQRNDHERAMPLLYASLQIKNTGFANKWIGMIHLQHGNPREALPFLERAEAMSSQDDHLLYHLGVCYVLNKRLDHARTILQKMKKTVPGSLRVQRLEELLTQAQRAGGVVSQPQK
ncbi:MAG: tetratricopeptide repeat protein [Gammaproteobacteria bacterium]|nr:tetratricopeptide repeat protein [Gammaproteobacteria bacterium]